MIMTVKGGFLAHGGNAAPHHMAECRRLPNWLLNALLDYVAESALLLVHCRWCNGMANMEYGTSTTQNLPPAQNVDRAHNVLAMFKRRYSEAATTLQMVALFLKVLFNRR